MLDRSNIASVDAELPQPAQQTGRVQKPRARKSPGSGAKRSESSKRKFICSFSHYGCDTALSSKNEWKRHVAIQHLQLGFYRCDVGSCNPDANPSTPAHKKAFNDFNRKDLFTQHHRRMHKPVGSDGSTLPTDQTSADWRSFEDSLEEVRQRCWQEKRRPPMRSTCGFCGRVFEGEGSWNERMEHVGGHYSRDLPENCKEEREDEDLTNWSLQEGVIKESPTGRPVLVDQPPSAGDRSYNSGGHERKMLGENVEGLYGNDTTDDLTGAYTSMNGSGRPGSSSGQIHPLFDALSRSQSLAQEWKHTSRKEAVSNGDDDVDRLEDLINKLINPKKPRMTKRLQWKCVSDKTTLCCVRGLY